MSCVLRIRFAGCWQNCHEQIYHFLLTSNTKNEQSVTPICRVLFLRRQRPEKTDFIEPLTPIHGLPDGDHIERTMLHWAVENGWNYAMRDFSDKPKSWIDHQDRDRRTGLHIACIHQNHQVAEHLVDSGPSYLLKDKLGRNAVHIAAETGCRSIVRLFVDEPIREYGRDNQGRSLLHFLVMWQRGSLIEDFIKAKSPIIDVLDNKRRTPLSYAALYNNNEALEVLLQHGAKVNFLDSNGSIPTPSAERIRSDRISANRLGCEA